MHPRDVVFILGTNVFCLRSACEGKFNKCYKNAVFCSSVLDPGAVKRSCEGALMVVGISPVC